STDDYVVIYQILKQLEDAAKKSGLFIFLDTDLKFEKPMLNIDIDKDKAASMGITMQNIGNSLATLLGGTYVNRFSTFGRSYKVIPQVTRFYRLNPDKVKEYYVQTTAGDSVPLASVVNLQIETQPNELYHFQQLNSATLSAVMMPGKSTPEGLEF